MSGTRAAETIARKERLIAAAVALAAEGGYDAVQMRDVVGPAQYAEAAFALGKRRELEALHQFVDVAPVVGVDHRADRLEHLVGAAALDRDRLLRHDGVDAVGLAVDVGVDPVEFDLELLGAEAHRAEHTEAAGLADGCDDVATVCKGEDRVLDPEHVAERGSHGIPQTRSI